MVEAVENGTKIGEMTIRVVKGDLSLQEVDAMVFYARHDLKLGSGFGTMVSQRGGPSIQEELDKAAPLETCQVVATGGGRLKIPTLLHAVGPRFQEDDMEGKLRTTMKNILVLAKEKGVSSIAFPAMGYGFYGVPVEMGCRVMLEALKEHAGENPALKNVIICTLDSKDTGACTAAVGKLS